MTKTTGMILACLILSSVCNLEPRVKADEAPKVLKGSVTDRDGQPIKDVSVASFKWGVKADERSDVILTNAKGEFEISIDQFQDPDSRFVAVYKNGFALSAIYFGGQSSRAMLWPMKPVAVRIVDAEGNPIEGAAVAADVVSIDEAFIESAVPKEFGGLTSVVSREDGWAILRCTRPTDLRSVRVSMKGFGTQVFATEFHETRFNVLQLCQTKKAVLKVTRDQQPVQDWHLVGVAADGAVEEKADENRDPKSNQLLPISINFAADTTKNGTIDLEHVLVGREMYVLAIDAQGRYRGIQKCSSAENTDTLTLDFKSLSVETGKAYTMQVEDAETGEPVAGAKVTFWKRNDDTSDEQKATSNSEGVANVKLNLGSWSVHCSESPDGYSTALASQAILSATENRNSELPPLKLWKGKKIRGKIVGADLSNTSTRWVHVDWEIPSDKNVIAGVTHGLHDETGSFHAVIPAKATPKSFKIGSTPGHNGALSIESKDPLELKLAD